MPQLFYCSAFGGEQLDVKTEQDISKNLSNELSLFLKREAEFAKMRKKDKDDELLDYLELCAQKLGRRPNKSDVVGYTYIRRRLGPWNRVLERAGLEEKVLNRLSKNSAGR